MYAAPGARGAKQSGAAAQVSGEKKLGFGKKKRTHRKGDVCVFYAAALYARSSAADSGCPV